MLHAWTESSKGLREKENVLLECRNFFADLVPDREAEWAYEKKAETKGKKPNTNYFLQHLLFEFPFVAGKDRSDYVLLPIMPAQREKYWN